MELAVWQRCMELAVWQRCMELEVDEAGCLVQVYGAGRVAEVRYKRFFSRRTACMHNTRQLLPGRRLFRRAE